MDRLAVRKRSVDIIEAILADARSQAASAGIPMPSSGV